MRPIVPLLQPVYAALAEPAYALLRFIAGAFPVPHGMPKLFSITGDQAQMVQFFADIGLPPAMLSAVRSLSTGFSAARFSGRNSFARRRRTNASVLRDRQFRSRLRRCAALRAAPPVADGASFAIKRPTFERLKGFKNG